MPFIIESQVSSRDKNSQLSTPAPTTTTRYDVLSVLGPTREPPLSYGGSLEPPKEMILSGEKVEIIYRR